MTNFELTGYILLAIVTTTVLWALGNVLLYFLIRLQFIGWFIRSAANSQMLHGPTTITRCLLYGNAAYERWRAFADNGYSVEGIEWPKDALDATVPTVSQPMPLSATPPWAMTKEALEVVKAELREEKSVSQLPPKPKPHWETWKDNR